MLLIDKNKILKIDKEEMEKKMKEKKQEILFQQQLKQKEHQQMTQNLTRIREEAQRRIQDDRDNFLRRQEIELELKQRSEQSQHIQPKKQTKRATAPPPLRLPRNDLLQQKNTLIQSPRQIHLQSRFNSPRDVFLGSPREIQSPRSVLENAQYGHINVSIFEPENNLDQVVLHEYVNRCPIDEDLPPVPFVKARRDGEYILGQRKFAVSDTDEGPIVRIGGRSIVLIDFIEKQERVEAKKLKALGSAGSLLYLV